MSKSNATDFHTPASILASLTEDQIPAHLAKIKAHLASREQDRANGWKSASNSKVINQLKREIAHLATGEVK